MSDERPLETLEAFYYPSQVPSSPESLTLLGFLFDRVHFPAVYLPPAGSLDLKELDKEIRRIAAFKFNDLESIQLRNYMVFAGRREYISDFCVFGPDPNGLQTAQELRPEHAN